MDFMLISETLDTIKHLIFNDLEQFKIIKLIETLKLPYELTQLETLTRIPNYPSL